MAAPLPNEVLDRILHHLYNICREEKRGTSVYATVNPFWQEFFEKKHFNELCLAYKDFPQFNDYVVGDKRKLVKRIQAKIMIGHLQPKRGDPPEDDFYQYMITELFGTLATWSDIYDDKNPGRAELEILMLRNDTFTLRSRYIPAGWIYTQRLLPSRTPQVYVFDKLVLGINTYDVFKMRPRALHVLLRGLPVLQILVSENRTNSSTMYTYRSPCSVYERMLQSLPASVTDLRLSEGHKDDFCVYHLRSCMPHRRCEVVSLAVNLARISRQLRHLTASFIVDATLFFQPFWPRPSTSKLINTDEWVWEDLETMALTSRLLRRPYQNEEEVNHLLHAVSMAVRRMPKLRVLEIWNGDDFLDACVFRYRYNPATRRASLLLRGTREIKITGATARSWGETVRQKTGLESEIRFQRLQLIPPFSAAAVAWFLVLRDRVATQEALAFPGMCYKALGPEFGENWEEQLQKLDAE